MYWGKESQGPDNQYEQVEEPGTEKFSPKFSATKVQYLFLTIFFIFFLCFRNANDETVTFEGKITSSQ